MSLAEDAVATLTAAASGVETSSSEVAAASTSLGEAADFLARALAGSTSPAAESALQAVTDAAQHLSSAQTLLGTCAEDVRAYAAEAFGTPLPGATGPTSTGPTQAGALGTAFTRGVHDPDDLFIPKERAIAERLAEAGASVHPRRADHTRHGYTNPDAIVCWSPDDPGTITELKTLAPGDEATDKTVQNNVRAAARQLRRHGGGDVVIDARGTSLGLAQVRRGFRRAAGEWTARGVQGPRRVFVILPSGELVEVSGKGASR